MGLGMTETLLRDRVELEKQRDAEAKINRMAAIEQATAVLRTRFDAFMEEYRERAVCEDDLKGLKRELEADMKQQIGHICEHFDAQTESQSKDLLQKVEGMFLAQQARIMEGQLLANKQTRGQFIWWGLGLFGAILTSVVSGLIIFMMVGRG